MRETNMPIIHLQQQLRQLGRIRMGDTEPYRKRDGSEGRRPRKLATWRFTSPSKDLIDAAAGLYGGTVSPWTDVDEQWQVTTETGTLPIALPPMAVIDQWLEQWSGGGCQRRCDGVTEVLSMKPCLCAQEFESDTDRRAAAARGGACKETTRLKVILPELVGVGVWRLETHGYYAAVELLGVAQLLAAATQRGEALPGTLRIEPRERKVLGQKVKKFSVPVIDVDAPIGEVLRAVGAVAQFPGDGVAPLEQGGRATQRLPVGPAAPLPTHPQLNPGTADHQPAHGEPVPLPTPESPPEREADDLRPATQKQKGKVHEATRAAGLDDEGRHDLVFLATDGRCQSSQDLYAHEIDQVLVAADLIAGEHVIMSYTGEGDLALVKPDGAAVTFPVEADKVRAWMEKRLAEEQSEEPEAETA